MARLRLLVSRGKRIDLKADLKIIDAHSDKPVGIPMVAGPSNRDIEAEIRKVKNQLERTGHEVSVIER